MPYLRRFAPRTAPCPACRAKDSFPDRALVPWAKVCAGATFRAWLDHPDHADRYLSVAFQLEPRKSTLTPRILTSMRWGARPVAFLAPRHGGAWDNEFMSHRRIPHHVIRHGLSVWFDLCPPHLRAWRRRGANLRHRLLLCLRCRWGVPAEVVCIVLNVFLHIDDFNATPDAMVRLGAVAFDTSYLQVELVQVLTPSQRHNLCL